ncbi:sensor domain-containing protein [Natrinema halophilum]|uniref:Sensor domain-containing protein n=1 Tax=Natrinema halophilum TaxID=1699371 RepID=A0A7D5KS54_9EURY|nr:sensor domain-containing protein [Natrinema halophilum]QLG49977.1 sensor domain-containing protein [Natrinema halophilum]
MSLPLASVENALARTVSLSRRFLGVIGRKQTYANIVYLLLSFPLGIGYFTVLVTGAAIPIGLSFALVDMATTDPFVLLIAWIPLTLVLVCIGGPLALLVLFATVELAALERVLADRLLSVSVPTSAPPRSIRDRARRLVFDRGTWKGVGYLFSKFVLGTASFVMLTLGGTFTYALVAAPLHYRNETVGIHIGDPIEFVPQLTYQHDGWTIDISPVTLSIADGELISLYVDSLPAALAVSSIGVLVGLVVLHLFNVVTQLYARYTELLLRGTQPSIFSEPPVF